MIGQFELSDDGDTRLVRFRINCCAAGALPLVTPLDGDLTGVATGDWVEVFGQWDGDADEPGLDVVSIRSIDTPDHPYLTIRDPDPATSPRSSERTRSAVHLGLASAS
ncbi:MAG: hypothetical protein R2713_13240 [Ilumatobacteraceae bacterium]